MLHVAGDFEPFVLALLPHRDGGGDEIGVVERAQRNGDGVGDAVISVINGRAAVGSEVEVRLAVFAGGDVDFGFAGSGHIGGGEADLCGERAADALLAIAAMADRDVDRGSGGDSGKLAAAAGGGVGVRHWLA